MSTTSPMPEAKLKDLIELTNDVLPEDIDLLRHYAVQAVQAQDETRWGKLKLQGSDHKDSGWYKGQGPVVRGLQSRLREVLEMYDLRGFQLEDWDVYIQAGESVVLSRQALLDLGVDADIIEAATVRTPHTSLVIKKRAEGGKHREGSGR